MNLSFAGCGFLGIYHIGVVSCFHEYAPNLIKRLSGASAGAMAACCFLCDCPLGQLTSDALNVATSARRYTLGPFNPKFDVTRIMQERLDVILPSDAHKLCTGRLRISVTRVSDGKNVILNQFNSKQELIDALQCSSFIPIFSGIIPPTFRGVRYIDGCYSDNLPILDENTVTVSPFCGESDICPRDKSYNLLQVNLANTSIEVSTQNLYRFMRVLFPPHPEILSQMCKQGFEDALHFLQKNDLISCARCIAINSTLRIQETNEPSRYSDFVDDDAASQEQTDDESNCVECKRRRQVALLDDLPEAVLSVFEEACSSVNKGLLNWIFKHKSMRVLSILTLPYVLPLDIAYVMFVRFMEMAPKLGQDFHKLVESLLSYAKNILLRFNKNRHFYSAKFTCQLAITEYDYDADDGYIINPMRRPTSPLCPRHSITPVTEETMLRHMSIDMTSQGSRVLGTVNFGFTVDLQSKTECLAGTKPLMTAHGADEREETAVDIANAVLNWDARKADMWDSQVDTFENILDVTRKQDALMAYYYLDERNQLKVTEIFNVTDADTSAVLTSEERETNRQLVWDEESWSQVIGKEKWMKKSKEASLQVDSLLDCSNEEDAVVIDTSDEIFNSSLLSDENIFVPLSSVTVEPKHRRESFVIMDPR